MKNHDELRNQLIADIMKAAAGAAHVAARTLKEPEDKDEIQRQFLVVLQKMYKRG